jgi:hypothetical protein
MPNAKHPWRLSHRLLAVFMLFLLVGCADEPDNPEAQLRAVIEAGEAALQARELEAAMALVDPGYKDARQRDWRQLRALLAAYFFRHPRIFVMSKIDRIEILGPQQARVVVFAGLAGSAKEAAGPLVGWRSNLLRFDLEFSRPDEGEWLVRSADWRQAVREDFTR